MNEESIFAAAIQRTDSQQRAAFLDGACGDDSQLRERLEALLRSHEGGGSFLDEPAAPVPPTLDMPSISEGPGTQLGPYKLMEQIGEGGMGLVFVAEQQRPIRRKVALKIIRPGMDTKEVIARFEAERQALALMDHPHIARVLDAGATESGRPYFVMELVKGIAITQYCDRYKLPTRQRLELFVTVCQAVQHAHLKGIIHRDLKPSNVLVTEHGGEPIVKIIDFGVAKAINQQLTERTIYTRFQQMVGTPMYMSPEQAELSGLDVDTRSDIYSLGVLLYEILTGTPPFDRQRFSEAAYDEIRRIIREEEPPKPSTKISTLGAPASDISNHRQTDPRRLSQLLRGELDWIVMTALEKDRGRRYETASSFAADVQAYLDDEPVRACPPSVTYRMQKLMRRHKAALTVAAGFFLILAASSVVAWTLFAEARRARNRAVDAREDAVAAQEQLQRQRDVARTALNDSERLRTDLSDSLVQIRTGAINTALARANSLIDQRQHYEGLLWLTRALEMAPADDQPLNCEIRTGISMLVDEIAKPQWVKTPTAGTRYVDGAISRDGRRAVAIEREDEQSRALLWDTATGRQLLSLPLPLAVEWADLSEDGRILLVSDETELQRWDLETRTQFGKPFVLPTGFRRRHPVLAVSPQANRLALFGQDQEGVLADLESGQTRKISGRRGTLVPPNMAFSQDGNTLLLVEALPELRESRIRQVDVQTGKIRDDWEISLPRLIAHFDVSPDNRRIVVCTAEFIGTDGEITNPDPRQLLSSYNLSVLDHETGESLWGPALLDARSIWTSYSPDGKRLLSVTQKFGRGVQVSIWDTNTGRRLHRTPPIGEVAAASLSNRMLVGWGPDNRSYVYASEDVMSLWRAPQPSILKTLLPHPANVKTMRYSADAQRISTLVSPSSSTRATSDNTTFLAHCWDLQSAVPMHQLPLRGRIAAISPEGSQAVSANGKEVQRWDLATGNKIGEPIAHPHTVVAVRFTGNGQFFFSQTQRSLSDIRERSPFAYYGIGAGMENTPAGPTINDILPSSAADQSGLQVDDVLFSANGRILEGYADLIEQIDLGQETPLELTVLRGGKRMEVTVVPRPKSKESLSPQIERQTNGQIRLYHAKTGEPVGELPIPLTRIPRIAGPRMVSCVMATTCDGRLLLTVHNEVEMRLWDTGTGRPLGPKVKAPKRVGWVEFAPDGRSVATLLTDGSITGGEVRLWDADNLQPLGSAIQPRGLITAMTFSPDGALLATAFGAPKETQQIQLWSTSTTRPVGPALPLAIRRGVGSLAFHPAGDQLAVATWQGPCVHFLHIAPPITGSPGAFSTATGALTRLALTDAGTIDRLDAESWSKQFVLWDDTRDTKLDSGRDCLAAGELALLEAIRGSDTEVNEARELFARSEPEFWRAHIWRLRTHVDADEWKDAEAELQEAVRLGSPELVASWLQADLGSLLLRTGLTTRVRSSSSAAEAQERLLWYSKHCVSLDPKDWSAQLVRARVLAREDRLEEAKEAFQRALATGPRTTILESFHASMAGGIRLLGDLKTDESSAERNIAQIDWRLEVAQDDWRTLLDRAIYLTYLDRWDDASRDVRKAIESGAGQNVAAKLKELAVRSVAVQGARERASDAGRRSLELPNPETVLLLARQAIWALDFVVEITPDDLSAVYARAQVHGRLRHWREAADDLTRCIKLDPEQQFAWYQLGPLLLELGEIQRYQKHCQEMLKRYGDSTGPVLHGRARQTFLWRKDAPHDWQQLAAYFDNQARSGNLDSVTLRWRECAAGIACFRSGQLDAAIKWLEQSLANDPLVYCEARARSALAMAYWAQGDHDQARETLEQARDMFSDRVPPLDEGPIDDAWVNWLIAKILYREAEQLIMRDPIDAAVLENSQ